MVSALDEKMLSLNEAIKACLQESEQENENKFGKNVK